MSEQERFQTHTAVFMIVRNRQGEILLQQRANTGFLDGYWDFPSGHIESGESLIGAALRELEEEACLQASAQDLELVHINQNFLDIPYLNFTFTVKNWQGEPKIGEPDKTSGMKFYATTALPEKCSLGVRVMARVGFQDAMTYSLVNAASFESVMGEPFNPATWGKE